MPETDALVLSHEDRLQRSETFASEVAAQMAALTEQLKQVGEKVIEVGVSLKGEISSFRETNAADHQAIKAKIEEHDKNFTLLLNDRELREKRVRTVKRVSYTALLAVLGGVATRWGEVIFNWLTGHR